MGNNQHLKRHSAPTTWPIKKKNITFITKAKPGSHKMKYIVPVIVLIRDVLKYAETAKEVKLLVHANEVLVNGKKIVDVKFPVGLFDVFEIKNIGEKYIVLFDCYGKLKLIPTKDSTLYLKIMNKKQVPGKKLQLNFMNGYNLLVDEKTFNSVSVEDTVLFNYEKKKIEEILPLKKGSYVYFFDGKFTGYFGEIKNFELYNGVTKDIVEVQINSDVHSTAKEYCYVVGKQKGDLKKFD